MSTDNANLEDMVEKTLESTGVLPKIRAELRANVFHVLEKGSAFQDKLYTRKIKDFVSNKNGPLLLSLVKDLFECLELTFTKSVFDSETGVERQYQYKDENDIFEELHIAKDDKRPMLLQILESYQSHPKLIDNVVKNYATQHNSQTYDESPLAKILQNSVDSSKTIFDKPKSLSPIKTSVLEENTQFENHTHLVSSSSNFKLLDNTQLKEIENSESLNSLSIEQLSPVKRLSIDGNDNVDKDVKSDLTSNKNESSLEDVETDENVSYGNDSLPSTDLSTEDGSPEMIKTCNIHL